MGLVKAKMSFYHDAVGTRAQNEVFEVQNAEICAQLEQAGYIQTVEGQEAQAHQDQQNLQQQVGQRNALTNEAVSLANHVHNQEANAHTQNIAQVRQQQAQQAGQQAQQAQQGTQQHQEAHMAQQQQQQEVLNAQRAEQQSPKATAKKADK